MGTTYTVAKPDILTGATGQQSGFISSWGTALALAPKAGNQLSVANRSQTVYSNVAGVGSAYAADPSGVVDRYNKRFNEHTYYTA